MSLVAMDNEVQGNTDNYDALYRRIVVEGIGSGDVISVLKRFLPKSSELLKEYLPGLQQFIGKNEVPVETTKRKGLVRRLSGLSFIAYEDMLVSVPEGFKGKFIPYLETLLKQNKIVTEKTMSVLANYSTELSMFLSNADVRKSLSAHKDAKREIRKEREELIRAVEVFFDKKSTLARRKLRDVVDRFGDIDKVFALEERLTESRKQLKLENVIAETKKLSEMLTLVKSRIDSGDIADVSGQAAIGLSEGAYEVAKYLEYVSLHCFFVEVSLAVVKNFAEKLESQVK